MSTLDDLRTTAGTVRDAITSASEQVRTAHAVADDLYQEVTSLGLEGIAATIRQAQDCLENAASSTASATESTGAANTGLGEMTDRTERTETLERLGAVFGQHDQAISGIDTAAGCVKDAYAHDEHADVGYLPRVASAAFDALSASQTRHRERQGAER